MSTSQQPSLAHARVEGRLRPSKRGKHSRPRTAHHLPRARSARIPRRNRGAGRRRAALNVRARVPRSAAPRRPARGSFRVCMEMTMGASWSPGTRAEHLDLLLAADDAALRVAQRIERGGVHLRLLLTTSTLHPRPFLSPDGAYGLSRILAGGKKGKRVIFLNFLHEIDH